MQKLWYKTIAQNFNEALPIGNGRIGGMVYGGVNLERISLNEDTLWSGYPKDKSIENAYSGIKKAIKLLNTDKCKKSEYVIWKNCLSEWTEVYQPAGELIIELPEVFDTDNYYRELNLSNAIVSSEFEYNGFKYKRETFCSNPHNIMALRQTSDDPMAKIVISLDSPHIHTSHCNANILFLSGIAPSSVSSNYADDETHVVYDNPFVNKALSFSIGIMPVMESGSFEIVGRKIIINSNDFSVYLDIATNFEGFNIQPKSSEIDTIAVCTDRLKTASKKDYQTLKTEHIQDYKSLFDRVSFSLCGDNKINIPTDQRIMEYMSDKSDNGLAVLLFDYGRYLTIAASRIKTQPMNLQGIWNEEVAPPWSSNYTININTQMNYWHVETGNLSECHMPLIEMISELSENGKKVSVNNYNCGGWCSHHNTDLWRQAEPVGKYFSDSSGVMYSFWNSSGAWLVRHIWEHYEYTLDMDFLNKYWPVIKGAAVFFLDWLVTDKNGKLVTPITTSPENRYIKDGIPLAVSKGCAMDTGIILDVFSLSLKAIDILKTDNDLKCLLEKAISNLKSYSIGSKGQLLEWDAEYEEMEPNHRHMSLLYGLYPGYSINKNKPIWSSAAKKTLELRGDEATGWSLGWKINLWARLGNGDKAKYFLDKLLRPINVSVSGGVYPNLLDAHPPFQIDGNFGAVAGIIEMLMQQVNGKILLLPAIPKEWHTGHIDGLKIKGNKTIDFVWQDGRIIKFNII